MSKIQDAIQALKVTYLDVPSDEATQDVSALRSILLSAASTLKVTGENVGRALNAIVDTGVASAIVKDGTFTADGRKTAMSAWLTAEGIDLDRRRVSEWRKAAKRIDGIAPFFAGKVSAGAVKVLDDDADPKVVGAMFDDMVARGIAISHDMVRKEGRKDEWLVVPQAKSGGANGVTTTDISPQEDGDTPVSISDSIVAHEAYNTLHELVKAGYVLPMGLAKSITALVARSNTARNEALKTG